MRNSLKYKKIVKLKKILGVKRFSLQQIKIINDVINSREEDSRGYYLIPRGVNRKFINEILLINLALDLIDGNEINQ